MRGVALGGVLLLVAMIMGAARPPARGITITTLLTDGGRVAWSHALNLIAYDREGADGYTDVYAMRPNGQDQRCLTCDLPGLTTRHVGNPAWHPNGLYLAVQVEKQEHEGGSDLAWPGFGINNDIWVIRRDRTAAYPVTNVAEGMGVLHPHFSPDGSKLLWSERLSGDSGSAGVYALKLMEVSATASGFEAGEVTTLQPLGPIWYESHGFSPDGTAILFTAYYTRDPTNGAWMDGFKMELATGLVQPLTQSGQQWDEHAHVHPSGEWISWASSNQCGCDPLLEDGRRLDLWMMRPDGTGKRRLTWYNVPGHPLYSETPLLTADHAWNEQGNALILYVLRQEGERPYPGSIVRLDFSREALAP